VVIFFTVVIFTVVDGGGGKYKAPSNIDGIGEKRGKIF